jgi:hypothetical protein
MKSISLTLILTLIFSFTFAQCLTKKYKGRADSLFNLQITKSDFKSGKVFLTLDTTNMSDISVASTYIETDKPTQVIKNFTRFIKSLKIEGGYYNYYELINSPFYESPLNISYVFNTISASYLVRIWTCKSDTSKIEGITVGRYSEKQTVTPW